MHTQFLFLLEKESAEDSLHARRYTLSYLENQGFTMQGRWGSGLSDWFVIGGRWSGELMRCQLDQKKLKRMEKKFDKNYGWWTDKKHTKAKRLRQYTQLFMKTFPDYQGKTPHWRNQYEPLGYGDDAMVLNQAIYDSLLKQYEGESDGEFHCVHDYEHVDESMVDKYWVIVVDYHC